MFIALTKISVFVSLWCIGLWTVSEKQTVFKKWKTALSAWCDKPKQFALSQLKHTKIMLLNKIKEIKSVENYDVEEINSMQLRVSLVDNQIDAILNSVNVRELISKPLILCPICMSSFHSALFLIMFVANVAEPVGEIPQDLVFDIFLYLTSFKGIACWLYLSVVASFFNQILYFIYRKTKIDDEF